MDIDKENVGVTVARGLNGGAGFCGPFSSLANGQKADGALREMGRDVSNANMGHATGEGGLANLPMAKAKKEKERKSRRTPILSTYHPRLIYPQPLLSTFPQIRNTITQRAVGRRLRLSSVRQSLSRHLSILLILPHTLTRTPESPLPPSWASSKDGSQISSTTGSLHPRLPAPHCRWDMRLALVGWFTRDWACEGQGRKFVGYSRPLGVWDLEGDASDVF